MKDEEKVCYGNLSNPLKIAVITAYVVGALYLTFFILGAVMGV